MKIFSLIFIVFLISCNNNDSTDHYNVSLINSTIKDKIFSQLGHCKPEFVKQIDLSYDHDFTDNKLAILKDYKNLEKLNLEGTSINGTGLIHLKGLSKLKLIKLKTVELSEEGYQALGQLRSIKNLALKNSSDNELTSLKGLVNLEELELYSPDINDRTIELLSKHLTKLRKLYLNLGEETKINFKSIQFENLEELSLSGNIIPEDLTYLAYLKNLKILDLASTNVSDEDLKYISQLINLEELELSVTNITGKGFLYLRNLKKLKFIGFQHTKVANEGFNNLAKISSLEKIDLQERGSREILPWEERKPESITQLGKLKNLKYLDLTGLGLINYRFLSRLDRLEELICNDIQLNYIKNLKHLKRLSIFRSGIDSKDLRCISKIKSLEYLNLTRTWVKDLSPLKSLTNLRELYLCDNSITGFSSLKNLKQLESISLLSNNYNHYDENIKIHLSEFKHFKNLKKLDMEDSCVIIQKRDELCFKNWEKLEYLYIGISDNEIIKYLKHLKNLKELIIWGDIDDETLLELSQLKELRSLKVKPDEPDKCTQKGLRYLVNLIKLKELSFKLDQKLTNYLKQRMPCCHIDFRDFYSRGRDCD